MVRYDVVMTWYVYMVRCADDTLYTGIAKDVSKRVEAHNAGRSAAGARYTSARRPVTLCYVESAVDKSAALRREYAIKRCMRTTKEALVNNTQVPSDTQKYSDV